MAYAAEGLAEEQLLGLSSLAADSVSNGGPSVSIPPDSAGLPSVLAALGCAESVTAAELLRAHITGGAKAVDARLKAAGIKSMGQRLKVQNALQQGAPPPRPSTPRDSALELLEELRERSGAEYYASISALAAGGLGQRAILRAELKRFGYTTGARLKLEQALCEAAAATAALAEDAQENARLNAQCVEDARLAALAALEHEERLEAARSVAAKEAARRVAEEAEAAAAERARLYEQYLEETQPISEVEKLKAARKQANATKREVDGAAEQPQAEATVVSVITEAMVGEDGGVQSLAWLREGLGCDDDGDEAHGFIIVERCCTGTTAVECT